MKKQLAILLASLLLLVAMVVAVERTFSPSFQQCIASNENEQSDATKEKNPARSASIYNYVQCTGQFLDASEGTITAIATIIIAAFTGTLWFATSEQGRLTEEALIVGRRAFVFANSFTPQWEARPNGQFNWRLTPIWQNSGETATRGLKFYSDGLLTNVRMQQTFDLNQIDPGAPPGPGMLAPKIAAQAGFVPHYPGPGLTPQDILDIQASNKFFYMWGWARYHDSFPNTEEHITRFCWQILVTGDPLAFNPAVDPTSVTFFHIHQARGNCADEECVIQGLG